MAEGTGIDFDTDYSFPLADNNKGHAVEPN